MLKLEKETHPERARPVSVSFPMHFLRSAGGVGVSTGTLESVLDAICVRLAALKALPQKAHRNAAESAEQTSLASIARVCPWEVEVGNSQQL